MKTLALINLISQLFDIFALESKDIKQRRSAVRQAAIAGQRKIDHDKAEAKRGVRRDFD